jgi:hypothetical protein
MEASLPPAIITSASPRRMQCKASPSACVPEAQAETMAKLGPRAPTSMAMRPGHMLAMSEGNRERRHLARAALGEHAQLALVGMHAADAGTDDHAHPVAILPGRVETGVAHRLAGRAKAEVRVAIVAPRVLRIHVLGGVPIAHLGADLAGVVRRIELRDAVDAAAAGDEAGPEGIDRMAQRSDGAQTGDNDATGSGLIHNRQERQTIGGSAGKPDSHQ